MAFLVDETSSEQSNRQTVYKQLFEFLQKPLPSDIEVLLMRFNGALHIETPWTPDAGRLRGGRATMSRRKAVPLLGAPGQLSDNPEQGEFNLQLEAMDAVLHVRTSLAGLFDALRVFPESPGRKALFVVTDGAPFLAPSEIAKDLIATSPTNSVPGAVPRSLEEPNYDRDLLFDSLAWSRSRSASMLTEVTRLAVLRDIEVHPVRSAAHDIDGRVRTDRGFHDRASTFRLTRIRSASGCSSTASGKIVGTRPPRSPSLIRRRRRQEAEPAPKARSASSASAPFEMAGSRTRSTSGRPEQTRLGDVLWLVRSGRVSVKPGSYRWSFAVRDDQTGITPYLTFDRALP